MLSAQDKKDMLEDAASTERRESFRRLRQIQESRRMTLDEYCQFCESTARLFPSQRPFKPPTAGSDFRL